MSGKSPKIFVVDDDPTFRGAVVKILDVSGYRVVEESRMLRVIDSIVREKPDLIMIDLNIPQISGMEIIKNLHGMGLAIPILVVSGKISLDEFQNLREFGVLDFLSKPVTAKSLLAKIESILKVDSGNNSKRN
jgi:DNA-binding response OmpR family regulator